MKEIRAIEKSMKTLESMIRILEKDDLECIEFWQMIYRLKEYRDAYKDYK